MSIAEHWEGIVSRWKQTGLYIVDISLFFTQRLILNILMSLRFQVIFLMATQMSPVAEPRAVQPFPCIWPFVAMPSVLTCEMGPGVL